MEFVQRLRKLRVKMADIDEVDGASDEEVEAMTAGEVLQKLEEVFYFDADVAKWCRPTNSTCTT